MSSLGIRHLLTAPARWLASPGDHDGIVVSSRIRLARNRVGTAFRRTLDGEAEQALVEELLAVVTQATDWPRDQLLQPARLSELERQALVERQLISREIANGNHPSGLCISPDQVVTLMLNEEDHVRLQVISAGLCLDQCLARAQWTDRDLEKHVAWAIHPRLGYLTACHTNCGTGLRASVMLHLPALAETGELKAVLRALDKLHMTVRGLHGEGSEATGHYYQVSNARTLGIEERSLVGSIHAATLRLIEAERLARQALLTKGRLTLEDKIYRGWGLLTHARSLTSEELNEHLSWVRLGLALRLLPVAGAIGPTWANLDRIFLLCQPAHLQLLHMPDQGAAATAAVRDQLRSGLVRDWIQAG